MARGPMTQEEQEFDRADLAAYLSCTAWQVLRCTHANCHNSSLWIMSKGVQIGVIARDIDTTSTLVWRVNKLYQGLSVTELRFRTLLEAARHAVETFDRAR